jgi:hypothetical protein
MPKRNRSAALEERLDEIVEQLLQGNRPKKERIRLMKRLVALGEKLPEELVEDALARIMERMLD